MIWGVKPPPIFGSTSTTLVEEEVSELTAWRIPGWSWRGFTENHTYLSYISTYQLLSPHLGSGKIFPQILATLWIREEVSEKVESTPNQWLFLVPVKGGREHITTQKAIYTTYHLLREPETTIDQTRPIFMVSAPSTPLDVSKDDPSGQATEDRSPGMGTWMLGLGEKWPLFGFCWASTAISIAVVSGSKISPRMGVSWGITK